MSQLENRVATLIILLSSALASAEASAPLAASGPPRLGAFITGGYLTSPGTQGGAVSTGLRLGLGEHFAASFDVGYGWLAAGVGVQDRWWVMPAVAWVIPAGAARIDLGAGVGAGTSSAFGSWSDYRSDRTLWAFQLAPAARAHVLASVPLTQAFDVFARVDVAGLLLEGNSLGIREGENAHPGLRDTLWVHLSIGVVFRLL